VASEWENYRESLLDIFKIWEGGLAVYGGIITGVLVIAIWSRTKKSPCPRL
jgi:phosphatidylglycerol:prolipoprotein diacylglycerol transferase